MNTPTNKRSGLSSFVGYTLLYGVIVGVIVAILQAIGYQHLTRKISTDFYVGFVALLFASTGVWIGLRFTRKLQSHSASNIKKTETNVLQDVTSVGLSKRELEVLVLMSEGHSNQEIADKLFLSLNTIKTHSSNVYLKLDAKRRTQAISRAKELGIIP